MKPSYLKSLILNCAFNSPSSKMWASHILPLLFFYFWQFCKHKIHRPVFWGARKMERNGKNWEFFPIWNSQKGGGGVAQWAFLRIFPCGHISHRRRRHFLWSNFAPHAKIGAKTENMTKMLKHRHGGSQETLPPRDQQDGSSACWKVETVLLNEFCTGAPRLPPPCLDRFTCSGHLIVED